MVQIGFVTYSTNGSHMHSVMHIIILALESTVHGITIHWQCIIGIRILLITKVSYDNLVHGADWTRDLFNKCWY